MSVAPLCDPARSSGLLDAVLAEQRTLSAVDVFTHRHDRGELPAASSVYEARIPLGRTPRPGQQLAFRVDLDACTGCMACVTACHSLNGLAAEETWRDVGLLLGPGGETGTQQPVTTACHHCQEPACLAGCPVQAYAKDPVTGIVRHLDDQCIGCQYCILMCPYDVPRYNAELGIVRKCDMCSGRLAQREAPACVQGCPNAAISIEIVDVDGEGVARELLPVAAGELPDAATTRPTTRYRSSRPLHDLRAASRDRLEPAPAHDPLAVMLVLMQLSVGTLLFDALSSVLRAGTPLGHTTARAVAAAAAAAGLCAASFHLGRPRYAFRAFLGWRTSWMSREILAFGAYAPLVGLGALASALAPAEHAAGWAGVAQALRPLLCSAALVAGLAGTACSIMIYVDTRRPAWALSRTAPSFAGTGIGLGALAVGATLGPPPPGNPAGLADVRLWLAIGMLALSAKLAAETRLWVRRREPAQAALARTSRLLRGPLRRRLRARFALAAAGLLAAGLAGGALGDAAPGWVWAGFACFALGEIVERHLYFRSEASPAMPGR